MLCFYTDLETSMDFTACRIHCVLVCDILGCGLHTHGIHNFFGCSDGEKTFSEEKVTSPLPSPQTSNFSKFWIFPKLTAENFRTKTRMHRFA